MSELFLTRARLKQDAPVAALARLLVPAGAGEQAAAAHHLIWALFADGPDRRRDFLWRQDRPGEFLALSRRPPNALDNIFRIETQAFAPVLAAGDRLGFRLHANPVVAQPQVRGQRGKRQDVVMHALHGLPACICRHPREGSASPATDCPHDRRCRAERRLEVAIQAGRAWLARQGEAHGFRPEGEVGVDGYETLRLTRDGARPIQFGVLDFEGVLTVTDPSRFLAALPQGFGRARAFGCGLMLIRRAPGPARG